ncbi:hypothetical protein DL98DRAFT_625614 [Cadophora sp. DSE1049]|nr:hypothetical protein DL98DRAFT_625614 [Cadophora sp. DSE1049]
MEPLTALSLAGNVIQFIDFSCKLFSQGCELYKSTDGRLAVDDEIRLITAEIQDFITKIKSEAAPVAQGPGPDSNFDKICDEAAKIAEAILSKLEHRKLDKDRNRKFESFKRVWSQIWSQGELDALFARLSQLRDAINSGVLAAILSVLEVSQTNNREVLAAVAQLASRMEMFVREDQNGTRMRIIEERNADPGMLFLDGKTREEEAFTLSQWEEKKLRGLVNNSILYHLTYEMRPKRYEAVVEAHPKTFEWAFHDFDGTSLSTWLRSEHGLYWISGKPGSGKSTLMKHIFDDMRTKDYLETWARLDGTPDAPLIIASFFFWNSGTIEQRSQLGMLRSLLFQVFEQKPELLPIVLPSLWLKQYGKYLADGPHAVWSETWTLSMLMAALKRLTIQQEMPCKFFFLIDGLDEFDGDHEVLAELFNDLSMNLVPNSKSRVKTCVSSRPYVVFQENFAGSPTLNLQDLTLHDITLFVRDRFLGNGAFKKLAAREPAATSQLIQAVVSKAGGVFLWVFIVVKDLLRGIRNRDTIPDLWRRLDALPRELEPLYVRIMSQIDEVYLVWASKTFQLIRASRQVVIPKEFNVAIEQGYLSLVELYFALDETLDSQAVTQYHITARCACLLEVTKAPRKSEGNVQYLHRTAKDFLEDSPRWEAVLDHTKGSDFDPWSSMLRSKSLLAHRFLSGGTEAEVRAVTGVFITMLALAMRIDGTGPSRKNKITILDDAEMLLERHHIDLISRCDFSAWDYDHLPGNNIPQGIRSSLLSCALALNFTEYVALRLSQFEAHSHGAGKLPATLMLSYVESRAPFKMDMAITLVQQGADVNARVKKYRNATLWNGILNGQIQFGKLNEQKQLDPRLPQFMSTALASGADPKVPLLTRSGSLADYVEAYIRPQYPEEAEQLQNAIKKAEAISHDLKTAPPAARPMKRHWWKRIV